MTDQTPVAEPFWTTPATPAPASAADDLAALTPDDVVESPRGSEGMSTRTKVGVLATAVVAGALGVFALQGSGTASTAQGPAGGQGQLQGGPPGMQQGAGPQGGFANQGVTGTVSAISSTSITVDGTTATVSDRTQVVVDGRQGSLSDVHQGDTVFVHTEGTFAERIFVGGLPSGGPGFGPPPGMQQGQQQAPGTANGTTSST